MNKLIVILFVALVTSCNKSVMYRDTVLYDTRDVRQQFKSTKVVTSDANYSFNQNYNDVKSKEKTPVDINNAYSLQAVKQKDINKNVVDLNQSYKRNTLQKTEKAGLSQDSRSKYDDILNRAVNIGAKQSALSIQQNHGNKNKFNNVDVTMNNKQFNQQKQQLKSGIVGANISDERKNNSSDTKFCRIQCGNFKSKQIADELANKLKNNGFKDAEVVMKNGGNIVFVGNFKSREDGQSTMDKLRQSSIVSNCFFVF